ncbi:unnamed protein product [Caenorhabditis auriculariae]|uniref:Ig-like domain-containing protein n=1 Tax=Caenorhabditis auriculariae TaxID=2777116 RepID=A0A8S1GX20_9PELO|nr:unnamed protein product [Caenorhabditis auriculariae]
MKCWLVYITLLGSSAASTILESEAALCQTLVEEAQLNVDVGLEDVSVHRGESFELSCSFFGAPQPKITWHHRGRRLDTHPGAQVETLLGMKRLGTSLLESRLRIPCADHRTAGEYFCEATTPCSPPVTSSALVTISKEPSTKQCKKASNDPIEPWISLSTVSRIELPHNVVQLECRARGTPQPTIEWHRIAEDETLESIEGSPNYTVIYNGDLIVVDNGDVVTESFRCTASNSRGVAYANSTIIYMDR